MRTKLLLIFGLVLVATMVVMLISSNISTATAQLRITPAPTPTPGVEVSPMAYAAEGGKPVLNREEALQRAMFLDSHWAGRALTLTKDLIAANPDLVIVEQYTTRQEAADVYKQGAFVDPSIASEPVWVIKIKGKISVNFPGTRGEQEADSVTYVISQKTGLLLEIDAHTVNNAP
jgi:hypothetical protein